MMALAVSAPDHTSPGMVIDNEQGRSFLISWINITVAN
jgi:hypothetical protein